MSIAPFLVRTTVPVGVPGLNAVEALRMADRTEKRDLERIRKDPAVSREVKRFEEAVAKAKTPEELIKNPRALSFLLSGFGMGDQARNFGIARKALTEDPKSQNALVGRLPDQRWKVAAETLQFAKEGLKVLKSPAVIARLTDEYVRQQRIEALEQANPGMADAIRFKERAGSIKSVWQVLSDPVVRRVVSQVSGLPKELAVQTVEAQARSVNARFDVKSLADPQKVDLIARRYLMAQSVAADRADSSSRPGQALASLTGSAGAPDMAAIISLRRGILV